VTVQIGSFHSPESWFDMSDLGAVFGHEEPLPHSVQAAVLIRPDVCFGAHYGLNSDIALGPKGARN
jgi:hypothetical protein